MHCPWRYLSESALLCFVIFYLAIPLTCFLYVCQVQMENRNFRSYTVQDLVNKMKKLRQKYKQEKDKSSRSGTGKRKKWKFFEIIDRTLCDKPQVKPPLVIDSYASSTADLHDTVNDENSEKGIFSSLPKWLFVFFLVFLFSIFPFVHV